MSDPVLSYMQGAALGVAAAAGAPIPWIALAVVVAVVLTGARAGELAAAELAARRIVTAIVLAWIVARSGDLIAVQSVTLPAETSTVAPAAAPRHDALEGHL